MALSPAEKAILDDLLAKAEDTAVPVVEVTLEDILKDVVRTVGREHYVADIEKFFASHEIPAKAVSEPAPVAPSAPFSAV